MEFNEILSLVRIKLSEDPHRLKHVEMCCKTAESLAKVHHADVDKAKIAALLHDVTKLDSEKDQIQAINRCFGETYLKKYPKNLWHSLSAVCYAKEVCHVQDEDILNAILYHASGRPNMSLVEKIVYVSDNIEPGRTHVTEALRKSAMEDLDHALLENMEAKFQYLKAEGMKLVSLTEDAIRYYKNQEGGH